MSTLRALKRELFWRRLPHGLASWRLLHAGDDPRLAVHRQLWVDGLPRWPRAAWVIVELSLWLRWIGGGAWLATWRAVRAHGSHVAARHGVRRAAQARRVLALALRWCIPPAQAYTYGLFAPHDRARRDPALDHVFSTEVHAFHRLRNAGDPGAALGIARLRDKWQLAVDLQRAGISVAPTSMLTLQGANDSELDRLLEPGTPLFFKTRNGFGGEGAFAAQRHGQEVRGQMLSGPELPDTAAVRAAWRGLLAQDDILAQPRLRSHRALAAFEQDGDTPTVRLVTRRGENGVTPMSAFLEIPLGSGLQWLVTPVDLISGIVGAGPRMDDERLPACVSNFAEIRTAIQAPTTIPHWDAIVAQSLRAHRDIDALWAIAWDWIITDDGPRLLEGNSSWSLVVQQQIHGGLLQSAPQPSR